MSLLGKKQLFFLRLK